MKKNFNTAKSYINSNKGNPFIIDFKIIKTKLKGSFRPVRCQLLHRKRFKVNI